jgi:formylglycine-generating enzyme required for sulfatase activity
MDDGRELEEALSIGEMPTMGARAAEEGWTGRRWKAGERILGRYEVEKELGQGGMGVVYECMDTVGGVKVAVKALPPELSHNSVEMEEVRENFRLVHGLSHPNIAGVRTLEKDGRGEYFLVMEVAEGEPLRRWMRRKLRSGESGGRSERGGLPLAEVLPILRQVASALDYAHGERVAHRDVKPGNIMVDANGRAKVLDFGLAAQIRTSLSRASRAYRGTSGTGPYMSPEQWRGQPQDGQADLYALGVMAYEMLAGHLPFENGELSVLREVVLKEEVQDIPGLPKGPMKALRRALAKDPKERWESCGAFVDALAGEAKKSGAPTLKGVWPAALAVVAALAVAGLWLARKPKTEEPAPGIQTEDISVTGENGGTAADVVLPVAQDPARGLMQTPGPETPVAELGRIPVLEPEPMPGSAPEPASGPSPTPAEPPAAVSPTPASQPVPQVATGMNLPQDPPKKPVAKSSPKTKPGAKEPSPGDVKEIQLPGGARMQLAWCPPGEFTMGSRPGELGRRIEERAHRVKLTRGFLMGRTEVTQGQWLSVMASNNSSKTGAELPVDCVSWDEAVEFCRRVTEAGKREKWLPEGTVVRLPTEAEWEYACRAGSEGVYGQAKTGGTGRLDDMGWYSGTGGNPGFMQRTLGSTFGGANAVGRRLPNAWGLLDMHGNVGEWCRDWYSEDAYGSGDGSETSADPAGPPSGTARCVRGGNVSSKAFECRSASRGRGTPNVRIPRVGFRVVLGRE